MKKKNNCYRVTFFPWKTHRQRWIWCEHKKKRNFNAINPCLQKFKVETKKETKLPPSLPFFQFESKEWKKRKVGCYVKSHYWPLKMKFPEKINWCKLKNIIQILYGHVTTVRHAFWFVSYIRITLKWRTKKHDEHPTHQDTGNKKVSNWI